MGCRPALAARKQRGRRTPRLRPGYLSGTAQPQVTPRGV